MARVTRGEWAKRVERWRRSGLTAREFGREQGLRPGALSWWKWRLATPAPLVPVPPPIVEVALAASPTCDSSFEVVLRDATRVVVPVGFEPDSLRRLLAVLEGR